MKRNKIFTIVLVVTSIVILIWHFMYHKTGAHPKDNVHMVSLLKDKADPEIVLAKVGDYVQFNAKDGKEHNLSQGSGNATSEDHAHKEAGLESGIFKSDEAYRIQFKKIGIYSFHDHNNPDTYIRVIVNDK